MIWQQSVYKKKCFVYRYKHECTLSIEHSMNNHLLQPEKHIAALFWTFEFFIFCPMVNFQVSYQRLLEIELPITLKIFILSIIVNCQKISKLNDIFQHKVNLYFHCPYTWLHCSFLFITISVSGCHRSRCWNWLTLKERTHCILRSF